MRTVHKIHACIVFPTSNVFRGEVYNLTLHYIFYNNTQIQCTIRVPKDTDVLLHKNIGHNTRLFYTNHL